MTFLPVCGRHTNLWFFSPVFKRHTNLWLFHQFSNDILTYDFFTSFQTSSFRARWRSRQCVSLIIWRLWVQPSHGAWPFYQFSNLWLFYQFSDDILTYDFFTSFQTTYKPMIFSPVFKRHTNLWLFYQFSNDIQTYDFFTSFQTTY